MKSIRIYKDHEHWVNIFGIDTLSINNLLEKYKDTDIMQRNINLDILVNVVNSDWELS